MPISAATISGGRGRPAAPVVAASIFHCRPHAAEYAVDAFRVVLTLLAGAPPGDLRSLQETRRLGRHEEAAMPMARGSLRSARFMMSGYSVSSRRSIVPPISVR